MVSRGQSSLSRQAHHICIFTNEELSNRKRETEKINLAIRRGESTTQFVIGGPSRLGLRLLRRSAIVAGRWSACGVDRRHAFAQPSRRYKNRRATPGHTLSKYISSFLERRRTCTTLQKKSRLAARPRTPLSCSTHVSSFGVRCSVAGLTRWPSFMSPEPSPPARSSESLWT